VTSRFFGLSFRLLGPRRARFPPHKSTRELSNGVRASSRPDTLLPASFTPTQEAPQISRAMADDENQQVTLMSSDTEKFMVDQEVALYVPALVLSRISLLHRVLPLRLNPPRRFPRRVLRSRCSLTPRGRISRFSLAANLRPSRT
jgi:hypothetical protein